MVSSFTQTLHQVKAQSTAAIAITTAFLLGHGMAMEQAIAVPSPPSPRLTILPPLPAIRAPHTQVNVPDTIAPTPISPAQATATLAVHLVVKLSQRRVYVYRGDRVLANYPIAIGKRGWETPMGSFKVLSKEQNPVFKSFRTGELIYPGADNPLGVRWIGIWTDGKTQLGFHGTNQEELLGQAVSHGCIRMRNRDVTAMFEQVGLGTTVVVEP